MCSILCFVQFLTCVEILIFHHGRLYSWLSRDLITAMLDSSFWSASFVFIQHGHNTFIIWISRHKYLISPVTALLALCEGEDTGDTCNLRFERLLGFMLVINLPNWLITEETWLGLSLESVHRPFGFSCQGELQLSRSRLMLCPSTPLNGMVVHRRLALL